MSPVPQERITGAEEKPIHRDGDYVLYWMIASRRCVWNFSLERAVGWALELNRPEDLEQAKTYDPLWNAAHRQLLREGTIHNYLRMPWGKKIPEWSATPREALAVMIELNNKYALDGRDPNSCCGIFWVLGRYDRPWGPERPVFGKVRYMSSANTARKIRVREYLRRYGPSGDPKQTHSGPVPPSP